MQDRTHEVLKLAVTRNAGIVLSLPSAGMLRHHKSRFLGFEQGNLLIESVPTERGLIEALMQSRQPAGISFKVGHLKIMFAGAILSIRTEHRINADTAVEALALPMPTQIKAMQRRNNYRVRIADGCEIGIRVWRISAQARLRDRPQRAQEVTAELRDLSVGGAGVLLRGIGSAPPRISTEDRLRVELTYKDTPLLLEGKMRPVQGPDRANVLVTGIQFQAMEKDLDGRQTLAQVTRIVGELQREEARRTRIGLMN